MEQRLAMNEQRQQQMMSFLAKAMHNPSFIAQLVQHRQSEQSKRNQQSMLRNKKRRLTTPFSPGSNPANSNPKSSDPSFSTESGLNGPVPDNQIVAYTTPQDPSVFMFDQMFGHPPSHLSIPMDSSGMSPAMDPFYHDFAAAAATGAAPGMRPSSVTLREMDDPLIPVPTVPHPSAVPTAAASQSAASPAGVVSGAARPASSSAGQSHQERGGPAAGVPGLGATGGASGAGKGGRIDLSQSLLVHGAKISPLGMPSPYSPAAAPIITPLEDVKMRMAKDEGSGSTGETAGSAGGARRTRAGREPAGAGAVTGGANASASPSVVSSDWRTGLGMGESAGHPGAAGSMGGPHIQGGAEGGLGMGDLEGPSLDDFMWEELLGDVPTELGGPGAGEPQMQRNDSLGMGGMSFGDGGPGQGAGEGEGGSVHGQGEGQGGGGFPVTPSVIILGAPGDPATTKGSPSDSTGSSSGMVKADASANEVAA